MRNTYDINQNWTFLSEEGAQTVTLPHTIEFTPLNSCAGRNPQKKVWYERILTLPESEQGRRVFLRLGGVMGKAELLLNGQPVATSCCSYIPIVVDLTDHFRFGNENLLRVSADNRNLPDCPPGKPQEGLDFEYDGGIFRTAALITTSPLHITDPLLSDTAAGGGVFTWTHIEKDEAHMGVRTEVENKCADAQHFSMVCRLVNADGNTVACSEQEQVVESGQKATAETMLTVQKPNLWSPEDPALYTLICTVEQDGTELDREELSVGFRDFTYTYDRGLIWNGESRRISGGNYHPIYPYIGASVPPRLLRRDARKLRALGLKNVRSHYPFDDAFLDECDRIGLTVIVSNPGWQWFKPGIFTDRLEQNMRRIVRWQRNHPSIILWEPMPNESVVPMDVQQMLHDAVHEEYPYSPCFTASDHGPTDVSYRQYDPAMLEPGMEGYDPTKRYGTKSDYPLWIREYDDAPDNWLDHNCAWRTQRRWGDAAMLRSVERMLGMDAQCPTNNYITVYNKPNLCGYGMWPAIEYNRGYHVNTCWGGLLDLFRIPKFSAEFMDCQQDIDERGPLLYIANWWTDFSPKDVTVFSNAEKVRLYYNDVLVEERTPEPLSVPHPPFVFREVHQRFRTRDRGTLRAEALVGEKIVAQASQMTPGCPRKLRLEVDEEGLSFAAGGDVIVVRCYVEDREGGTVRFTADDHPILFSVTGPAEIIGSPEIGANPVLPGAGIASVLLRSTNEAGEIGIKAEMYWPQRNPNTMILPATLTVHTIQAEG